MKKVLVLCTGNSCRSQMAEAYLRHFAGDVVEIFSAGVEVHCVNPLAIASMKRDGIDISNQTSNNVDEYQAVNFDYIITVCDNAKERCPYFPGQTKRFHYNFPDLAKALGSEQEVRKQFDAVRNEIKIYSKIFVEENL